MARIHEARRPPMRGCGMSRERKADVLPQGMKMMSLRCVVLLSVAVLAGYGISSRAAPVESRTNSAVTDFSATDAPDAADMGLVAQDKAPSAHGHTIDTSNKGIVGVLRNIFVRAGTIDGKQIKDFTLVTRCKTAFVTDSGTVTIDWKGVGNYAGSYGGGRETFPINDGSGTHSISVPAGQHPEPLGNSGARTDSGFASLADSCQQ